MHDAMELEGRGTPAAVICTDTFLVTGQAMARARGLPDYPIVVVPHPVITLTEDELRQAAEKALPEVLRILTGQPG